MKSDQSTDSEERNLQQIPEELQDISLEEITEVDYEIVPQTTARNEETENMNRRHYGRLTLPGRVPNQDSIDASSDDPRGTDEGYIFIGYESPAATRIGDETTDKSDRIEKFRRHNDGRHRSDGWHSVRESRRDKDRLLEGICSSLPLASHEREKVSSVVNQLDFEQFGYQKGIPRVTLGVVAVVVDEKHRQENGDIDDIVSLGDEFRALCDAHDVSMSDLSTIKEKVRTAIEDGGVIVPHGKKVPKRDPTLPGPTPLSERPGEYWENLPPEHWENVAKHWEKVPSEHKEALPNEYRELVMQLRKWAPWAEEEGPQGDAPGEETGEADDLEKMVEELMDEMDDQTGE